MKSNIIGFVTIIASTMLCMIEGISVPTGKLTPIEPAKPTERPATPRVTRAPAPVHEYTEDNPEPPPLHPSYVPTVYDYLNALAPATVYYMPLRLKNIATYSPHLSNVKAVKTESVGPVYFAVRTVDYSFPRKQAYYEHVVDYLPVKQKKYHPKQTNDQEYQQQPKSSSKYYPRKIKVTGKSAYPKKAIQHQNNYVYYINQQ